MATSDPVLKSILRPQRPKKKVPEISEEQKAQIEKDKQNLEIAVAHANLIQHQKNVEGQILNAITALIDYPARDVFTSQEALTFTGLVKAFQPSDYDSLIEERRIDGRCGYTLCANQPRSITMGGSAAWKLKKGAQDWCSDSCAKKGLFIKTQLSEVPAWERARDQQPDVQLHEDDLPKDSETALRRAKRAARVDAWRQRVADDEDLAQERGEKPTSFKPNQVMTTLIVEKKKTSPPKPPELDEEFASPYDLIEGYQPRNIAGKNSSSKKMHEESDQDDPEDND
ncbi:uncharacterized protein RCC_03587 [Ramularia collo-cygni]|uniref:RNA polymerase II subunit B1 CTD phosphatase RPAP2 homolog n=1 Tax=Ramularia collo-cygni TaxID=112498 RepID=A0A2D3UX61_9PEZI|nr:uncharacterized protein RCC_03587 [Ramularia collo-cygni]CZT17750.1 uncharacterized protein RCC_03587 [Ramularia collo-cygni]